MDKKKYAEKFNTRPDSFSVLFYDAANFLFKASAQWARPCKACRLAEKEQASGLAGNYAFDKEQKRAFFAIMLQYHMKEGKAIPTVAKKYDFTK